MLSVYNFWDMLRYYVNGNSLYVFSGIAWLLFLYYLTRGQRRIAVLTMLIVFVAVYNPLSYWAIGVKLHHAAPYYRFLWIIPYSFLLAYLIYEAIRRVKQKGLRMILVCLICIGCIGMNITPENLKLPENVYQIPTETIAVAEAIESQMENCGVIRSTVLADFEICNTIREYDANICLPFTNFGIGAVDETLDEETPLALLSMLVYNRSDMDEYAVRNIITDNNIEYIVVKTQNINFINFMKEIGASEIEEVGTYSILRTI